MNRPDARAAQHGHRGLGNHRHINRHAITLFDPLRLQHIGKFANIRMQFPVGDAPHIVLRLALPDDRHLVARGRLEMPIQAVGGHIELAILKPRMLHLARVGVPIELPCHGRRLHPVQRLRLFQPEGLRLADGALVHGLKLRGVQMGALDHRWRGGKRTTLVGQGIRGNSFVRHLML